MPDEDSVYLVTFDSKEGEVFEQFDSLEQAENFVADWQRFESITNLSYYRANKIKGIK